MRHVVGLLFAIAVVLCGFVETEAACRAAGAYHVIGADSAGFADLVETTADATGSSGTVAVTLNAKRGCPVCATGSRSLTGFYDTGPMTVDVTSRAGGCSVVLRLFDPLSSKIGEVGGTLAFGGSVILFQSYAVQDSNPTTFPDPDLNLVLGIRTDSLLRP